ncbi:ChaN family lipoprotein [Geomonas subterranea]|uniref:ChaN family lipoprotein n=1 Tax=Geomonas subterranea TaxID=2847989 RepID=A0ABX8LFK5_9BACT|nr:ChaN family lipoprotein [Geomonas subterranea]QXE89474.1 ChaN family lipoprotein [Geomonas subterranea]QXM08411.1 ChaN family lipoprotein [Geomonas subterranea]
MFGWFRTLLVPVLVTLCCTSAFGHTIITRLSDGQTVSLTQLAAAAAASQVVLVGESHDEPYHHDLQLTLLRLLDGARRPIAIGLEMMQSDCQKTLDDWVEGTLGEPEMQQAFERNWTGWQMYRDIFLFAREKRIPMVALNVPLAIVRTVSRDGFAALTPEERKGLPPGTSCDLTNPQIAFLRKSFGAVAHHMQNGKRFDFFCEAQTVRNSGMALNIIRYRDQEPGRTVVVLTGTWHAVKYAIPEQLQRLGSLPAPTVILPETPYLNSGNTGASEADYLVEL